MKTILALMLSCMLATQVFANSSTLTIKLKGQVKGWDYLCLNNVGCVNVQAGQRGFKFPIIHGELNHISIVDQSLRIHPQTLPKSCDIVVGENESVTVTGKMIRTANQIKMQGLKCEIVKS